MRAFLTSRWWTKHLLLALFWTGTALLYVGMRFLAPALVGADLPDWTEQRWVILGWMMWIPMTYIAVGLARLFPLNTSRWPLYAPLHVVGAVLCSSLGGVLFVSLIWVFTGGGINVGERLQQSFVSAVPIDSLLYVAVLAGVYGFEYYRLHKEDQQHTERLRVMDDGPGPHLDEPALTKRGTGLQNVELRLQHLFGQRFSLSLGRCEHAGTTVTAVTIEVPYRTDISDLAPPGRRPGTSSVEPRGPGGLSPLLRRTTP